VSLHHHLSVRLVSVHHPPARVSILRRVALRQLLLRQTKLPRHVRAGHHRQRNPRPVGSSSRTRRLAFPAVPSASFPSVGGAARSLRRLDVEGFTGARAFPVRPRRRLRRGVVGNPSRDRRGDGALGRLDRRVVGVVARGSERQQRLLHGRIRVPEDPVARRLRHRVGGVDEKLTRANPLRLFVRHDRGGVFGGGGGGGRRLARGAFRHLVGRSLRRRLGGGVALGLHRGALPPGRFRARRARRRAVERTRGRGRRGDGTAILERRRGHRRRGRLIAHRRRGRLIAHRRRGRLIAHRDGDDGRFLLRGGRGRGRGRGRDVARTRLRGVSALDGVRVDRPALHGSHGASSRVPQTARVAQ